MTVDFETRSVSKIRIFIVFNIESYSYPHWIEVRETPCETALTVNLPILDKLPSNDS